MIKRGFSRERHWLKIRALRVGTLQAVRPYSKSIRSPVVKVWKDRLQRYWTNTAERRPAKLVRNRKLRRDTDPTLTRNQAELMDKREDLRQGKRRTTTLLFLTEVFVLPREEFRMSRVPKSPVRKRAPIGYTLEPRVIAEATCLQVRTENLVSLHLDTVPISVCLFLDK